MELIPGIRFDTEQSVLRDAHQGYSLGTSTVIRGCGSVLVVCGGVLCENMRCCWGVSL